MEYSIPLFCSDDELARRCSVCRFNGDTCPGHRKQGIFLGGNEGLEITRLPGEPNGELEVSYTYQSDEPAHDAHFEYVPLDTRYASARVKRYVFDTIGKLADSYDKGRTSGSQDLRKTDLGSPKKHAEFVGDVAVMGEEEVATPVKDPAPANKDVPHETPAPTTTVPTKVTKKPIVKNPKKATDQQSTDAPATTNGTKTDSESCGENCDGEFPKEVTNNTLANNNITKKVVDHHAYYTSTFLDGEKEGRHYWVDLDKEKGVVVSEMLSKSHRRAATVRLKFDFPFYGHIVRNMTVATGGFIYTGDYIHSWLAATQYIAPLMANFDTGLSADSFVKYRDNGTAFTVEWDSVMLQDKKDAGQFTFQVTLHKNGDIVFVYREIPILVENIEDSQHPVKVGISDAYIIDKTVFYVRKKTIFEYHRVLFNRDDIKNWTAIYLKALPTCLDYKDCYSCLAHNTSFECKWCQEVNRCSSGFDRYYQDWFNNDCHNSYVSQSNKCSAISERNVSQPPSVEAHSKVDESKDARLGHFGMLSLFIVVLLVTSLGLWVYHAYRNPHTRSGQFLIRYRPSQWSLRRGEARYTAATIHM
nr:plexin domain-containing protein 1 [Halyomorpha halys]